MEDSARIDKWLWTIRFYKTRSEAATACRGGKIKVNGEPVKAAKTLKAGDEITCRQGVLLRTIRVTAFPRSRVGAKLVVNYYEDLTPQEEYDKLKVKGEVERPFFFTLKGRPTKKDRRNINKYMND